MGRYTTVQTFTDQDAKASISYSAATTSGSGGGGGSKAASHYGPGDTAASSSAATSSSGNGDRADKHGEPKAAINRVDNVSGSSAGAGSGDFHMYRAARRRELDRVERMEKAFEQKKVAEEFERQRVRNMTEFEARVHKRAEKRRRRKERVKAKSLSIGDDSESAGDKEEEDESKDGDDSEQQQPRSKKQRKSTNESPAKPAALPETPGGVPEIPNDGSFLARMLAEQQKQKRQKNSSAKQ